MNTTIDNAGRIVIPKDIRRRAGLVPGSHVDVRYSDGHVEIEPAATPVRIVEKGRFLVAVPAEPVPGLTPEGTEAVRDALYQEREASLTLRS